MPSNSKKRTRIDAVVVLLLFFVFSLIFLFFYYQNLEKEIKSYYDYKNAVAKLHGHNQDYDTILLRSYAYLEKEKVKTLSTKLEDEVALLYANQLTNDFSEVVRDKLMLIDKKCQQKKKLIEEFIVINRSLTHAVYSLHYLQKRIENSAYENRQLENLLREILFKVGESCLSTKLDMNAFQEDLRSLALHTDVDSNVYAFHVQLKSFLGALKQIDQILSENESLKLEANIDELSELIDQEYVKTKKEETVLGNFFFLFTFIILLVLIVTYFNVLSHRRDVYYLAYHDPLTNLPNRTEFERYMSACIALGKSLDEQKVFFVLFIDLDRFKAINDNYGHDVGDSLLIAISKRLSKVIGEENFLARIGGDEFVAIIEEEEKIEEIESLVPEIMSAVRKPMQIKTHDIQITVSIGIARYPYDGIDKNTLLKHADIAMYHAKQKGRDGYCFYKNKDIFEK